MAVLRAASRAVWLGLALLVAGCEDAQLPAFLQSSADGTDTTATAGQTTTRVERDVEAPEIFQTTEAGLWDGRPSLGGVWVAHPDVNEPQRVLVRNEVNGKIVIGALFRRERDLPGPRLQVSSDAAEALGMLAGQPAALNVTALKREAEAPPPAADPAAEAAIPAPMGVETSALDDAPAVSAAPRPRPGADAEAPAAVAGSSLDKPFIQIGIFNVERNASNAAIALRQNGMIPTVLQQSSSGRKFWRVIVGPATSAAERAALLAKIKELGYADSYFVTN